MISTTEIRTMLGVIADDHFARGIWDEPPYMGVVAETDTQYGISWINLPGFFWEERRPHEVLHAMANAARRAPMPYPVEPGSTIIGMVFVSEGYGIDISKTEPYPEGWWETHRIADDPNGRELLQVMWAPVDDGPSDLLVRQREGNLPWPEGGTVGGAVHDAFREVVKAMVR